MFYSREFFFTLLFATSTIKVSCSGFVNSPTLFHHLQFHQSIILGQYLYVDGGELVTWNGSGNGIQDGYGVQQNSCANETCLGNVTVEGMIYTYAIDLSRSWTNATVTTNPIEKPSDSNFIEHALWLDVSNGSFYSYGGGVTWAVYHPSTQPNTFWRFVPDGNSGQWSQVYPDSSSKFGSLTRTFAGARTSGNGLGFVLGGDVNEQTIDTQGYYFIPGMIVYNSSSQAWSNVSSLAYSDDGTSYGSGAQFVPSFGPNGLLFILGGAVYSSGSNALRAVDSSTVHMYEPLSETWKSQTTTGISPPPMQDACVFGQQGDNGTYEIFLFGGQSDQGMESTVRDLGNVYVLSIPAFHWESTKYTPSYGRWGHTCNVVNRQMISIGGFVSTVTDYEANKDKTYRGNADPWEQGLGVFDMVEMKWKTGYDASAEPYVTPQIVKDLYVTNTVYPSSLMNDAILKSWFVRNGSQAATVAPNDSGQQSQLPKTNKAAIIGGSIGGVAAVAIIATAIWWFCVRKRKYKPVNTSSNENKARSRSELQSPPDRGKHELGQGYLSPDGRAELTDHTRSRNNPNVYEI